MKRMEKSRRKINDDELFEPDPCRDPEEEKFYKSTSNFFSSELNKKNINSNDDEKNNFSNSAGFSYQNEMKSQNFSNLKNNPGSKINSAAEERNLMYSDEFIKNELDASNKYNSNLKTNIHIQENEDKEIVNSSANNLGECFSNKNQENKESDYLEEISIESLQSEREEKF
jgi:hypothetical protein